VRTGPSRLCYTSGIWSASMSHSKYLKQTKTILLDQHFLGIILYKWWL